jgi:hypothetical protein
VIYSQLADLFHYREGSAERPSGTLHLGEGCLESTVEKRVKECTILGGRFLRPGI